MKKIIKIKKNKFSLLIAKMNKLLIISLVLIGSFIESMAQETECWKEKRPRSVTAPTQDNYCDKGYNPVAGLCYAPCAAGEKKQVTGWCQKSNGQLYLPNTYPVKCNPEKEFQAGLCYPKCDAGFKGIGVLCWSDCQANKNYKSDCGLYCGPTRK